MIYFNSDTDCPLKAAAFLSSADMIAFDENDIKKIEIYYHNSYNTVWTKDDKFWLTYYDKDRNIVVSDFNLIEFEPFTGNSLCIAYRDFTKTEVTYCMTSKLSSVLNGQLSNLIAIEDGTHDILSILPNNSNSQITLNSKNLTKASLPGLKSLDRYIFTGATKLSTIELSSLTAFSGAALHFSGTQAKHLYVDNDKLKSITDGINTDGNLNVVVDKKGLLNHDATLKLILPGIRKLSCDDITIMPAECLQGSGSTITDVYVRNLTSVAGESFNSASILSNVVVDNDVLYSTDDGYGKRTVILSTENNKLVAFTSNTHYLICNPFYGFYSSTPFKDKSIYSVVLCADGYTNYKNPTNPTTYPGCVVTKDDDNGKNLIFVSKIGPSIYSSVLNNISNDITAIIGSVFNGITQQSLNLPNVKSIGSYCFYSARMLSVNLPNCTSIGDNAFRTQYYDETAPNKGGIKYYNLSSLTCLTTNAFTASRTYSYSTFIDLTNVKIIQSYGLNSMFMDYTGSKTNKTFPKGEFCQVDKWIPNVETLESYAFNSTTIISSMTLPKVKSIGYLCFGDATKLKIATFNNCQTVEQKAFLNNINLMSCYLPSCKSFGSNMFSQCSKLEYLDASSKTVSEMNALTANMNIRKECYIRCKDGYIQNGEQHAFTYHISVDSNATMMFATWPDYPRWSIDNGLTWTDFMEDLAGTVLSQRDIEYTDTLKLSSVCDFFITYKYADSINAITATMPFYTLSSINVSNDINILAVVQD